MTIPKVALGDVCRQDRTSANTAEAVRRGLPFVGMEHVDPETGEISTGSGSRTGDAKGTSFLFDDRHVLFGKLRPYLRKIALPFEKGCSSTELVPLLADGAKLDRKYLFYWLRQPWVTDVLMAKHTGARMPRADMDLLLNLEIPLPSLDKQVQIVELLDKAEAIRHGIARSREKSRLLFQSLFVHTFGDPAHNPMGWPAKTLGDAILVGPQNGLYKPASDYGAGTRILRIDSFDDGVVTDQGELKRLKVEDKELSKFGLIEGDIVVNRVNSPPQLGKSAIVPCLEEPVVFESNMMRLRVDSQILLPVVAGTMLQLPSVRADLIKNAKHAINQSSINQGDVAQVRVIIPPLPLQERFAKNVGSAERLSRGFELLSFKANEVGACLSSEVFG